VLLRYIRQDDQVQSPLATQLIESFTEAAPGFTSLICLIELYWVMDHTHKYSKQQILEMFRILLSSSSLVFEDESSVSRALLSYAGGSADFDDCLIAECSRGSGCDFVLTFDKAAAKSGIMKLLA
jgi:predicted nucleic-acid-binding protein